MMLEPWFDLYLAWIRQFFPWLLAQVEDEPDQVSFDLHPTEFRDMTPIRVRAIPHRWSS